MCVFECVCVCVGGGVARMGKRGGRDLGCILKLMLTESSAFYFIIVFKFECS